MARVAQCAQHRGARGHSGAGSLGHPLARVWVSAIEREARHDAHRPLSALFYVMLARMRSRSRSALADESEFFSRFSAPLPAGECDTRDSRLLQTRWMARLVASRPLSRQCTRGVRNFQAPLPSLQVPLSSKRSRRAGTPISRWINFRCSSATACSPTMS